MRSSSARISISETDEDRTPSPFVAVPAAEAAPAIIAPAEAATSAAPAQEIHADAAQIVAPTIADDASYHSSAPRSDVGRDIEFAPGEDAPASRRKGLRFMSAVAAFMVFAIAGGAGVVVASQPGTNPLGTPTVRMAIPENPARQQATGGQEFITIAEVAGTGASPGRLPDLKATMRAPDGRVIKEWLISPPHGKGPPRHITRVPISGAETERPAPDLAMFGRNGQ
ncbi:hypothetical protein [Sphingomonas sp. 3-13AW]|uniref:hypothetical protein n=1 Tax=Sphingomonas sp. 3-13AW TaxID=3050450 RepID=UPI003BB74BD4